VLSVITLARDDDHERAGAGRALADDQQRVDRRVDASGHARQHALHLHGVRPRRHDALLRTTQLRRGDHLHRLRNLLRVLDRADAAP
jgi:hypothetical protein